MIQKNYTKNISHPFDAIYSQNSQILILGSFPSVKSREMNFYYANPHNRFWKILENVFNEAIPDDVPSKKEFIIKHDLALWDVIKSCDISGSSDASIKNVTANNIEGLLKKTSCKKILCNGGKAYSLLKKYIILPDIYPIYKLPSTSPANASWSLEKLTVEWKNYLLADN